MPKRIDEPDDSAAFDKTLGAADWQSPTLHQTDLSGPGANAPARAPAASGQTTVPFEPGKHIAGKLGFAVVPRDCYERGQELARGGMGRIFTAHDRRLDRPVALKELLVPSPVLMARFEREARITGRLQHPAIVPVYEAGVWPSGEPFYAMKLVAGESLDKVVAHTKTLAERLALLPKIIAVADALAYAHSHHIIHRDLKPANVLLGEFGETVVIDWGLAKHLDRSSAESAASAGTDSEAGHLAERESPAASMSEPDASASSASASASSISSASSDDSGPRSSDLTTVGATIGTPAYMAPEQAIGRPADERADVYSLGAMLYHVLAGQAVYSGLKTAKEIILRLIEGPPTPLQEVAPGVPADLAAIVAKAMARDPKDRYPSARELAEDLKRFQTGQLVSVHEYSMAALLSRWVLRNRAVVGVAGLMLVVLAITAGLSVQRIRAERTAAWRERERAEEQRRVAEEAQEYAEARAHALTLGSAHNAIERDPTKALAWLNELPLGTALSTVRMLAMEAKARGVARHVLVHSGRVHPDLAFLRGGTRLATTASDGSLSVWSMDDGRALASDTADVNRYALAVAQDGGWLAAAADAGGVLLWNPDTRERKVLRGHTGPVRDVAFAQGGNLLATTGADKTVWLWSMSSGMGRKVASTVEDFVKVSFSPDGRWIAISEDRAPVVLDHATGARLSLPASAHVYALEFSPRGTWIIGYGKDTAVYLMDVASPERVIALAPKELSELDQTMTAVVMTPDEARLAAASGQVIHVWDVAAQTSRALDAHSDQIDCLAISPDGRYLASGSQDGTIRLWDLQSGASWALVGHGGWVTGLTFSPDGAWLASGSPDGTARVWSLADGPRHILATDSPIGVLAFSEDRAWFAAGSHDGAVAIWERARGIATLLREHRGRVNDIEMVPGSARMITAGEDGEIRLWDLPGRTSRVIGTHAAPVTDIALYPGADVLVSVSPQDPASPLALWDVGAGTSATARPRPVPGAVGSIHESIALAPRGGWLAFASGTTVTLWNRESGQTRLLLSHEGTVLDLAFAPDGRLLATASKDGLVRVWSVGDHAPPQILAGHAGGVRELAFSADGARLASGGTSGDIWVWEMKSGQGRELRRHQFRVDKLLFSKDTRYLVSASADQSVRLWDLETGEDRVWTTTKRRKVFVTRSPDGEELAATISGVQVVLWPFATPSEPAALWAWMRGLSTARIDAFEQRN